MNALEIIFALAIPAIIGFVYVNNIRKEYKMENEKRKSGNYTLAYRASSEFTFATSTDELISHNITRRPITTNHDGGFRPGGMISGGSTIHMGGMGPFHGGRGRGRHF